MNEQLEIIKRYEELKKMAWSGEPRCPTDEERRELAELVEVVRELKEFAGIPLEKWMQR